MRFAEHAKKCNQANCPKGCIKSGGHVQVGKDVKENDRCDGEFLMWRVATGPPNTCEKGFKRPII